MCENKAVETTLMIDKLPVNVVFTQENIDQILVPLLRELTAIQKRENRRIVAFLGAPIGSGKSVLVSFLEGLSKRTPGVEPVQGIGLDGFHRRNEYLESHEMEFEGQTYNMRKVKGWPETFDDEKVYRKILELQQNDEVLCPIYDRNTHQPVEDQQKVTAKIVIIEGLWMMYDAGPWKKVQELADYRIMLLGKIDLLRKRAVARKIRGGMTPEAALEFFDRSDCRATNRILDHMAKADRYLEATQENTLIDLGTKEPPIELYRA